MKRSEFISSVEAFAEPSTFERGSACGAYISALRCLKHRISILGDDFSLPSYPELLDCTSSTSDELIAFVRALGCPGEVSVSDLLVEESDGSVFAFGAALKRRPEYAKTLNDIIKLAHLAKGKGDPDDQSDDKLPDGSVRPIFVNVDYLLATLDSAEIPTEISRAIATEMSFFLGNDQFGEIDFTDVFESIDSVVSSAKDEILSAIKNGGDGVGPSHIRLKAFVR